jgi:hypothetical protein
MKFRSWESKKWIALKNVYCKISRGLPMNDSFEGNGSAVTAPDFGVPYSTRREKLHARGKKKLF